MNPERAQWILSAWREDAPVAAVEELREALQVARENPAVADWVAAQQDLDARIRAELASIEPPPPLEDELFTQLASENLLPEGDPASRVVPFPAASARAASPAAREDLPQFLEAVREDSSLQEKLKADGADPIAIAREAGFAVTRAAFLRFHAAHVQNLSDEELEEAAGGGATGPHWSPLTPLLDRNTPGE
jgi:predicted ribosomally synthesized peptide with nif11-like leader